MKHSMIAALAVALLSGLAAPNAPVITPRPAGGDKTMKRVPLPPAQVEVGFFLPGPAPVWVTVAAVKL